MAGIQTWKTARVRTAGGQAPAGRGQSHRPGLRLWAFLNAQALLDGMAGTPGPAAEDDHRRLAARRAERARF